jgi:Retrotransposon gag protein
MNNNDPDDDAPDPPGGGGPVGGAGQLAYNPDEYPQSLCSSLLNMFDGTRDKVDLFLQAFGLYRAINCWHITMRELYNCIMMMLSYLKGPKIDDWVWEKVTLLETAVSNGMANLNDEHVWNTFIKEFTEVFTDTTRREQATLDLINIQIKGEDLDTYIFTFHHLWERARWEPDVQGTILMFCRGLKCPLATAIVKQMHPWPQTLHAWYQATQAHHATYTENKATMVNPFLWSDTCSQWEQALKGKGKSWRRNDDAMDIDAVNTSGSSRGGQNQWAQYNWAVFLTNKEWKMLLKERRCFNYHTQGHMSKNCQGLTGPCAQHEQVLVKSISGLARPDQDWGKARMNHIHKSSLETNALRWVALSACKGSSEKQCGERPTTVIVWESILEKTK